MTRRGMTGGGMAACALALALLAGCSKSDDGPPADATEFVNVSEPATSREEAPPPRDASPPPAEPAPEPDRNVAEALPPEAAPSLDEQMREDADAAGLTARASTPDVVTDPAADPMGAPSNGLDGGR